jgi:hypothetical protein
MNWAGDMTTRRAHLVLALAKFHTFAAADAVRERASRPAFGAATDLAIVHSPAGMLSLHALGSTLVQAAKSWTLRSPAGLLICFSSLTSLASSRFALMA